MIDIPAPTLSSQAIANGALNSFHRKRECKKFFPCQMKKPNKKGQVNLSKKNEEKRRCVAKATSHAEPYACKPTRIPKTHSSCWGTPKTAFGGLANFILIGKQSKGKFNLSPTTKK